MAAAILTAVGRYRLPGGIPVSEVLDLSEAVGRQVARARSRGRPAPGPSLPRTIPVRAVTN